MSVDVRAAVTVYQDDDSDWGHWATIVVKDGRFVGMSGV